MSNSANKAIVEKMWQALGEMDWDGMKACMHPEIFYEDVPSDDPGAHGLPRIYNLRIDLRDGTLSSDDVVIEMAASN